MTSLQSLPQELFKQIVEYVMQDDEPVDFAAFLASVEQANRVVWIRRIHKRSLHQPVNWDSLPPQAMLQGVPLVQSDLWRRSRSLQLKSHLRDWSIACIHSQQFKAMGKIAFWEMKTFLMTVPEAKQLRKSRIRPLSLRDQSVAAERIWNITMPLEELSASILKGLCKQIRGFPRLSQLTFSLGWSLGPDDEYDGTLKTRPAPYWVNELMSSYGVEAAGKMSVSLQIHSNPLNATWENLARFLMMLRFPGVQEDDLIPYLWQMIKTG
ncbi:MAG: hypothetical protein OHK93_001721 [Ramalina farinacea]|uniref:Uncharacterized protein n=1 Tax=Ramalina farinacea TaxID=258253 RepID=A0AA43TZR3_9LECA|nr:hypothetical protein [Ramalina farinacea]